MKKFYRKVRYHWLAECIQSWVRHDSTLKLKEINLELEINPGDVIIDCGANVGDITSLFARTGATVFAFEPNPLCFTILSKRFKAMSSVHCFNQGVMDRRCTLTLSTPNAHEFWDSIETTVSSSFEAGAMDGKRYTIWNAEVECIDLDEFIRSLGGRVRLLKVDIEGAELPVLNRLIDSNTINLIDSVVVETHERQMPHLLEATNVLRKRIQSSGLETKIQLDWY
jgi:FkbM family methyltransferase